MKRVGQPVEVAPSFVLLANEEDSSVVIHLRTVPPSTEAWSSVARAAQPLQKKVNLGIISRSLVAPWVSSVVFVGSRSRKATKKGKIQMDQIKLIWLDEYVYVSPMHKAFKDEASATSACEEAQHNQATASPSFLGGRPTSDHQRCSRSGADGIRVTATTAEHDLDNEDDHAGLVISVDA
ncbi:hypothetical protein PR202_ga11202 [Eleusine coracana subsp. coracana]|uniref:Uncharacterized protein n=1 Tax=Eleusine coracana subsp. coracana TaxID=191504 RepID=A0AAV5C904_ELECO|nr:hypothetical protein PR202_ga11202 [Eleusine coracana subsp. coracana]